MIKTSFKRMFLNLLRVLTNDKLYYKVRYFVRFKHLLNFKNPITFSAKINYLKLYNRNPLYSNLVDKFEVRNYVGDKIGYEYLNKLIGVYESVEEIDFRILPESFVLKATHGSSWVIVCEDKQWLDKNLAIKRMQSWLNSDFYKMWGEWVYKNVKPRIICECFLSNENEISLLDYKFHCFNGEPKFIQVDLDRAAEHERNFYDLEWKRLPFGLCYPQAERDIKKPKQLNLMINLAKKLSADFEFVRVDFYVVDEKVVFGELTFYPGNGLELFSPKKYDEIFGKHLKLKAVCNK